MASVAVWLVFHPTNVHPAFVAVYSERFTVSHDLKLTTGLLVVPPFVVALNVTTEDHSHLWPSVDIEYPSLHVHFAYNVVFSLTYVVEENVKSWVSSSSANHQTHVEFALVGSVGFEDLACHHLKFVCADTLEPPLLSKVKVKDGESL